MNIISELTKDCPRMDCAISGGDYGTSTCMGWTPTYDKSGNRTDGDDPNITTWRYKCSACGAVWTVSSQRGETSITKHAAFPSV